MSNWYYADAQNTRQGPVDDVTLSRLLGEGQLRWDSLVWREGMADWRPLGDFADTIAGAVGGDTPAPAAPPPAAATAAVDSPYAPPTAQILLQPRPQLGDEVVYAGFWKRVAAYMIDSFVLGIASYAIQLPLLFSVGMFGANGTQPTMGAGMGIALVAAYLLPLALQTVYFAWFHAGAKQATLGKMAVGIKVVNEAGGAISFARGVGRYFGLLLSSLTIGVGFLMAAFTDRKRALHDLVVSTLVVDQWAYTDRPDLQRRDLGVVTIVILVLTGLLFVAMLALVGVMLAAVGAGFRQS